MKDLTKRQRQILDYISDYICESGYPPTIREICDEMGLKSTNGVSEHIETLRRKGFLIKDGEKSLARAMRPKHLPRVPQGIFEIPLLGSVTAGSPRLAIENTEERLCIDRHFIGNHRDVFALTIDGDSMIEHGINDGDMVFVKRTDVARDGEAVVFLMGDEATCKLFYKERGKIRLQPANSTMEPIYVDDKMFSNTMILGVVIGLYRNL